MAGLTSRDFRTLEPEEGARIVVIGDIHGCYDELTDLLRRVDPSPRDAVVSVGDVVTKGPRGADCLDLWRDRGFHAVKGNNEIRLLGRARPLIRFLVRENHDVLRRGDLLRYIASWPLVVDFPRQRVAVVHGGFLPAMEVTPEAVAEHAEEIFHLRWIRKKNGGWKPVPKEKRRKDDVLWSEKWRGDRFVVYGHTPLREPKFDKRSLGLDTGCVYGGSLTAAILLEGEWSTVSVPARAKYAD